MTAPPDGYHPDPKGDNCKVRLGNEWVTVSELFRRYHRICYASTKALTFLEAPPATKHDKKLASDAANRIRVAIHGESGLDREAGL